MKMVDSSNGAHGSFFDLFSNGSSFGFFNSKDPVTNLPPILRNVSQSPTFNGLGGSGIIGNGLCGLQPPQHSMLNGGGMGQLTGFGHPQGNKSPTYNNPHSPIFSGGPSSPTSFFGNSGNANQFSSYSSSKQFPITTFSIEDTIQVSIGTPMFKFIFNFLIIYDTILSILGPEQRFFCLQWSEQ